MKRKNELKSEIKQTLFLNLPPRVFDFIDEDEVDFLTDELETLFRQYFQKMNAKLLIEKAR